MRALRSYGLTFLAFGVPFGLLAGVVVGLLRGSAGVGVVSGLAAGGLGGGVFALVIGVREPVDDPTGSLVPRFQLQPEVDPQPSHT